MCTNANCVYAVCYVDVKRVNVVCVCGWVGVGGC